jgi:hypothetical protein
MLAVDMKIIECVFYETLLECITEKFTKGLSQSYKQRGRFFEARVCNDDLLRGFKATSININSKIE